MDIPSLTVAFPIVCVPPTDGGWEVSWLGDQAGWLNGTSFPTHAGNSVISAHVYGADGSPEPFLRLNTPGWGDQGLVHAYGQEYVYEVRDSQLGATRMVSVVISPEKLPWLTAITCQGYELVSNSYR